MRIASTPPVYSFNGFRSTPSNIRRQALRGLFNEVECIIRAASYCTERRKSSWVRNCRCYSDRLSAAILAGDETVCCRCKCHIVNIATNFTHIKSEKAVCNIAEQLLHHRIDSWTRLALAGPQFHICRCRESKEVDVA